MATVETTIRVSIPDEGATLGEVEEGVAEADCEPDAHAGQGAQHQREQDEEAGVEANVVNDALVPFAVALHLRKHQEEAAADGELRDEDVDDGHPGDEQPAAEEGEFPNRVVHRGNFSR